MPLDCPTDSPSRSCLVLQCLRHFVYVCVFLVALPVISPFWSLIPVVLHYQPDFIPSPASSSGPSVFRMAEASAKRVTGDEPQRTMGRVETAGEAPARSCVVFLAKKSFSCHGPIFGLLKSCKRPILVAYCCKNCKL